AAILRPGAVGILLGQEQINQLGVPVVLVAQDRGDVRAQALGEGEQRVMEAALTTSEEPLAAEAADHAGAASEQPPVVDHVVGWLLQLVNVKNVLAQEESRNYVGIADRHVVVAETEDH